MSNFNTNIIYLLGLFILFSSGLTAQDHDIDISISAETIIGDDGAISLRVNDVFSETDNPDGINTPPFSFEWLFNGLTFFPDPNTYDVDELLGTCSLVELTPGEYCVIITQNADTDFACSVEGCFIIEAFEPGEFNIGIDAPINAIVGEEIPVYAEGGNNGGGSIDWLWGFPEANISSSTEGSENIIYDTPGVKTITLSAINETGQTATATHQINISSGMIVDFDFIQTSFSPTGFGFGAFFEANVVGGTGHLIYQWFFGDGDQSPPSGLDFTNHFYSNHGSYTVTLTVIDDYGSTSVTKNITITSNEFSVVIVSPEPLTSVEIGQEITFVAQVYNPIGSYNYTWFFGDGTSEMTNSNTIAHAYSTPGCKGVFVWATDAIETTSYSEPCLVVVDNYTFQIDEIGITDYCKLESLTLTAHASGGETYTNNFDCNLLNNRRYKNYEWTARTADEANLVISGIFTNPISPCTQLNTDHSFFSDLIGTGGEKNMRITVRVTDDSSPNQTLEYETILTLQDDIVFENQKIVACPGTEIPLQLDIGNPSLASSLSYVWTGNSEEATNALSCTDCPIPIVEVLNGDSEYLVKVTQERLPQDCIFEATFNVSGQELVVNTTTDGTHELMACIGGQSVATLGGEPTASGGSENYTYHWVPFYNLNNPTVPNPTVVGIGMGQSQNYTLTVVDEYGCTETAEVKVTGSSSQLTADAGIDVFTCFGSDLILEGNPTGIGFDNEGNPLQEISYKWTNSENEVVGTSEQLIFENITDHATSIYTVQVIDPQNGCNSTDEMSLVVNPEINILGFEAGLLETACLGASSDNAFDSAPNSLPEGYSFYWDPLSIVSDPESLNPVITPNAENSFSFLVIQEDESRCTIKKMSKPWALFGEKPAIQVSYNPEDLCPGQEVCFSVFVDFHYLSHQLEAFGLITPHREIFWSIRDEVGEVFSGSYSFMIDEANTTQICTSFGHIGEYQLIIEQISNSCGSTSFQIPINIGANTASSQVCNNSTTNPQFVIDGLYTGNNLEVAPPSCDVDIFNGQTVSTVASESITISEGFFAENGSQFVAKIGEVDGCEGITPLVQQNTPPLTPYKARGENITSSKISIYPNPFSDQLNLLVHSDDPIKKLEIFIQSSVNQALYKISLYDLDKQATIPIVLDKLRPGVYWCMVILDGEIYNQKVIKM